MSEPIRPRLLTLEQAALFLHETITVSALRAAIRDGRLRKRRIGRRYYLTPSEIKDFLRCPDFPRNTHKRCGRILLCGARALGYTGLNVDGSLGLILPDVTTSQREAGPLLARRSLG